MAAAALMVHRASRKSVPRTNVSSMTNGRHAQIGERAIDGAPALRGDAVIAARRPPLAVGVDCAFPSGRHQAVALVPAQRRIHGARSANPWPR